ncbi:X2-like carbohydrate binding domain-containing protein [Paenibacillus sp. NPDC055715]
MKIIAINGEMVTFSNSYLSKLTKGDTTLTFHFNAGSGVLFTVTVKVNTPSEPGTEKGVLKVQTFNSNVSKISNTTSSKFKITNTGTSSVSLADVTLRTINGDKPQNFFADWSSNGG